MNRDKHWELSQGPTRSRVMKGGLAGSVSLVKSPRARQLSAVHDIKSRYMHDE